jgi:hypothetical protein
MTVKLSKKAGNLIHQSLGNLTRQAQPFALNSWEIKLILSVKMCPLWNTTGPLFQFMQPSLHQQDCQQPIILVRPVQTECLTKLFWFRLMAGKQPPPPTMFYKICQPT